MGVSPFFTAIFFGYGAAMRFRAVCSSLQSDPGAPALLDE
jgi:hypothetical protein